MLTWTYSRIPWSQDCAWQALGAGGPEFKSLQPDYKIPGQRPGQGSRFLVKVASCN